MFLQWKSNDQMYEGFVEGEPVRVDADEMLEAANDLGVSVEELSEHSVFYSWEALSPEEQTLLAPENWMNR
jgi:hypothetical protein